MLKFPHRAEEIVQICSMFNLNKSDFESIHSCPHYHSFLKTRTCTTCEKSFASSLGLKHHLAKTNDCGLEAKKVKKAQEIKKRATRNHVLKYMRTKEISNQNLSVRHKRGAALSRAEKEVVLHTYESFKSMTNLVFNHECNILTCI